VWSAHGRLPVSDHLTSLLAVIAASVFGSELRSQPDDRRFCVGQPQAGLRYQPTGAKKAPLSLACVVLCAETEVPANRLEDAATLGGVVMVTEI
jgi:hypothetical protein